MAERTRGFAHRIDVRAAPPLVWRTLTEPALLALWYAPDMRVDARAGGRFSLRTPGGVQREAHIDVFDPPRRLRLIYMPSPTLPSADAVIVDDFVIDGSGGTSVLRLLGSGIPEGSAWDPLFMQWRDDSQRALRLLKLGIERRTIRPKAPG